MPATQTKNIDKLNKHDDCSSKISVTQSSLETLQAIDDINNHRNLSRKFSSVEELMTALNS